MSRYIARRLLLVPFVLLLLSFGVFALIRLVPGDVVAERLQNSYTPERAHALRVQLGLDAPLWRQYPVWLGKVLRGDFGRSFVTDQPIRTEMKDRLPVTAELVLLTVALQALIAIPAGAVAALRRNRLSDRVLLSGSLVGLALPSFWVATLVIVIPSRLWGWSPPFGYVPIWKHPVSNLEVYVLPVIIGSLGLTAILLRLVRTEMLETLRQDYIRTARAKGLSTSRVVWRHALKNALIPVVTVIGLAIGNALAGTVIIETIFSLPGLGSYAVTAVQQRDYPAVQAFTLLTGTVFIFMNLFVDILYAYLNPAIRFD